MKRIIIVLAIVLLALPVVPRPAEADHGANFFNMW